MHEDKSLSFNFQPDGDAVVISFYLVYKNDLDPSKARCSNEAKFL